MAVEKREGKKHSQIWLEPCRKGERGGGREGRELLGSQ